MEKEQETGEKNKMNNTFLKNSNINIWKKTNEILVKNYEKNTTIHQ